MHSTRSTRRRTIGALAAAGACAAAAFSAAGATGQTGTTPPDRVVEVTLNAMQDVDQRPKGPSAGDGWVGAGPIREGGKVIGRVEAVSTLLDPKYEVMVQHGVLLLPDGTLTYEGAGTNKPVPGADPSTAGDTNIYAITGGTGAYTGADGTITLASIAGSNSKVTGTIDFS